MEVGHQTERASETLVSNDTSGISMAVASEQCNRNENQGSHLGGQNKRKGLCRDGKQCDKRDTCLFRHEIVNKSCRYGANCNKKPKCLFLHERINCDPSTNNNLTGECTMYGKGDVSYEGSGYGYGGAHDPNSMRQFRHSNNALHNDNQGSHVSYAGFGYGSLDGGYDSSMLRMNNGDGWGNCIGNFGSSSDTMHNNYHRRNKGTWNGPSERNSFRQRLCVRGQTCKAMDTTCTFSHKPIDKLCRNGSECPKRKTCLFSHGPGENGASIIDNSRGQFNKYNDNFGSAQQNIWLRAKN